jgi:hypothetical protein
MGTHGSRRAWCLTRCRTGASTVAVGVRDAGSVAPAQRALVVGQTRVPKKRAGVVASARWTPAQLLLSALKPGGVPWLCVRAAVAPGLASTRSQPGSPLAGMPRGRRARKAVAAGLPPPARLGAQRFPNRVTEWTRRSNGFRKEHVAAALSPGPLSDLSPAADSGQRLLVRIALGVHRGDLYWTFARGDARGRVTRVRRASAGCHAPRIFSARSEGIGS